MIEDPRDPGETPDEGEPTPDGVAPPDPEAVEPEAPEPESEEPASEEPEAPEAEATEEPAPEAAPPEPQATEEPSPEAEEPGAVEEAAFARPAPSERQRKDEVIPGAHLEPDLVLDEVGAGSETEQELASKEFEAEEGALAQRDGSEDDADQPLVREPLDFAKDARYQATGKRKHAIARVILKPGDGTYRVNGRSLDDVFPRVKLQRMARQPLETAGYGSRMDVAARIHGGGVSAQAGALRHGIARALVEADPNLRVELKKRGFLTRDPRVKERKKAGLKKARKRPQFSKR